MQNNCKKRGEKMVKKGAIMPQALRQAPDEYIRSLKKEV